MQNGLGGQKMSIAYWIVPKVFSVVESTRFKLQEEKFEKRWLEGHWKCYEITY